MYVWCRGITYDRLRETIAVDLAEELGFLDLFDRALRGIQQVVDLPDKQARDLARFVLQNDGSLSARKRARFAELTDDETTACESAVRAARTTQAMTTPCPTLALPDRRRGA